MRLGEWRSRRGCLKQRHRCDLPKECITPQSVFFRTRQVQGHSLHAIHAANVHWASDCSGYAPASNGAAMPLAIRRATTHLVPLDR